MNTHTHRMERPFWIWRVLDLEFCGSVWRSEVMLAWSSSDCLVVQYLKFELSNRSMPEVSIVWSSCNALSFSCCLIIMSFGAWPCRFSALSSASCVCSTFVWFRWRGYAIKSTGYSKTIVVGTRWRFKTNWWRYCRRCRFVFSFVNFLNIVQTKLAWLWACLLYTSDAADE